MMKRFCVILAVLLLCMTACRKNSTGASSPTVDSNATITRTLPSIYITEDAYHFDAQGYAQSQGYYSVTYDDIADTFTFVMSGDRYNKLVADLYENIRVGVAEIPKSDYYSYIKDIQYTDDFGQFTLYVERDTYLAAEDFTPEYIASFAIMYREVLELSPQISFSIISVEDETELGFMILPEEE